MFDERPMGTFRRMALPELWVARHGETAWTISRQHTGRTDLDLTEEGERVAREVLGPKLRGVEFDLVLSSPLRRALQTARLAGFDPELDERLREFDYGEYEGLTTAEIKERRPDWDLWTDGCPGGETVEDVGARMDALIAERLRTARRVLIFAHGHALRILTARWVGLPPREGRVFLLSPAAVGVTGEEHGRPAIARWDF
jgi:broad specificity phosphatase PhoE